MNKENNKSSWEIRRELHKEYNDKIIVAEQKIKEYFRESKMPMQAAMLLCSVLIDHGINIILEEKKENKTFIRKWKRKFLKAAKRISKITALMRETFHLSRNASLSEALNRWDPEK